jgi:replicative DNA helicase
LEAQDYSPIVEYQIDTSFFPGYEKEFEYIRDYFEKSHLLDGKGEVPNSVSFTAQFPDFTVFSPGTAVKTIMHDVRELKLYTMLRNVLEKGANMTSEQDSYEATTYLVTALKDVNRFAKNELGGGNDIIRRANERLSDYIKRLELGGMLGVPTGDKRMDKALHGWLPEDFIVLFARTNEGKSWLILYYMLHAWLANKKVAFYAGEMNALMMGYRFDTLYKHFSNRGLISGNPILGGAEVGNKTIEEYRNYIEQLTTGDDKGFTVFTQKDFDGKITPDQMKILQDKYEFDIWGLDQFTQMDDNKRSDVARIRFGKLSEQLYSFTEEYQIPVIGVHQANRKAAENKKNNSERSPELEEVFDSDAIMQNATRGISWTQIEGGAKAKVVKNRYGEKGLEFHYSWIIDLGLLEPRVESVLNDAFSTNDKF